MATIPHRVCMQCGFVGYPKTVTPGHILLELLAWCLFIIPGLLYSLWRHAARHQACPQCGAKGMIPKTSPVAQRFLQSLSQPSPPAPPT